MGGVPRKITALLLGVLLSLVPRALLGSVFGQLLDMTAELAPGAYPTVVGAAVVVDLVIGYAMAFVTGFSFWAGTSESWRASGAWGASGSAVMLAASSRGGFESALVLGLAVAVRVAGAFHGARWGDDRKDDARVEGVQGFIFRLNPFPL